MWLVRYVGIVRSLNAVLMHLQEPHVHGAKATWFPIKLSSADVSAIHWWSGSSWSPNQQQQGCWTCDWCEPTSRQWEAKKSLLCPAAQIEQAGLVPCASWYPALYCYGMSVSPHGHFLWWCTWGMYIPYSIEWVYCNTFFCIDTWWYWPSGNWRWY